MFRIPIPLLLAAVVSVGAVVTIVFTVVVKIIGSYDAQYATFNGTHVLSTALPSTANMYLYGGATGEASFTATTTVNRYGCFGSACVVGSDFGHFFPTVIEVVSGNFPFGTTLEFNQPYGVTSYRVRIVLYTDGNGWVAGQSRTNVGTGQIGAAYAVKWYQSGNKIYIYPVDRGRLGRSTSEGCSVAAVGTASYRYVVTIQDSQRYDCAYASWGSATLKWTTVASSVTTATWNLGQYTVVLSGSDYVVRVYLMPLLFINPPAHFVVKP